MLNEKETMPTNDARKKTNHLRAELDGPSTSDSGHLITTTFSFVGMMTGCFLWAWVFDFAELNAPIKWLGQGATISTCILVALAISLLLRRNRYRLKSDARGPVLGAILVLTVWGTSAMAANWYDERFATGAWCAALGCFGFVGHKLHQPRTRIGFMSWVYGLLFTIGLVTMYASVAGQSDEEDNANVSNTRFVQPHGL